MSKQQRTRPRKFHSTSKLAVSQRLRLSWTRWSLTRMDRRLAKQSRRLELMQTETDLQGLRLALLLREKEQLKLALREQLEIKAYRQEGWEPTAEPLQLGFPREPE